MIKRLQLKNYMSYKDLEMTFPKKGLFLIKGYNHDLQATMESAIEVGKTNLFEAILFTLFGKTARNLTKADYIFWGENELYTEIELYDGTIVKRTLEEVSAIIEGKEYKDKITSVQNQINSWLNCNYNAFFFATFFGYGYTSIVDLSPAERLRLFTSLFSLDILDKCSTKAKQKVNQIDTRLQKINYEIAETTGQIKELSVSYEDKKEKWENEKQEKKKILLEQKQNIIDKINKAQEILEAKKKKLQELQDEFGIEADYKELRNERDKLEAEIKELEKKRHQFSLTLYSCEREIKKLKEQLNQFKGSKCPLCGSSVSNKSAILVDLKSAISSKRGQLYGLNEKIEEIDNELIKKKAKLSAITSQIDNLINFKNQTNTIEGEISKFKLYLQEWKNQIDKIKKDLVLLDSEQNPYESLEVERLQKLNKMKTKLDKLVIKQKQHQENSEQYSFWITGFKQVKMMMLNDLMSNYQKLFNSFLSIFGSKAKVKIDFSDTGIDFIFEYGKREVRFDSYSSGVKQLLRLSSAFALQSLLSMRIGKPLKLLVLDEPCVNLSLNERHKIVDYLMQIKNTKQIFLIDHAIDVQQRPFDKVLMVEKKEGISEAYWK